MLRIRATGAPCVVKVRQPVRETGPGMQQRCGRPPRHPRIAVGGAGDHALEQAKDTAHRRFAIEGGDKMHLGRAGVGEADIDAIGEKRVAQPISPVHSAPPARSPPAGRDHPCSLGAIQGRDRRADLYLRGRRLRLSTGGSPRAFLNLTGEAAEIAVAVGLGQRSPKRVFTSSRARWSGGKSVLWCGRRN